MNAFALRCDIAGVITAVLHGRSDPERLAVGRPFPSVLDDPGDPRALELLERVRREDLVTGFELVVRAPEGPRALVAAGGRDDQGILVLAAPTAEALHGLCASLPEAAVASRIGRALEEPLSERSAAGEPTVARLFELYEELERTERELESRYARLVRVTREKDRILGMASHDLRTPLSAIAVSVDFLELRLADRLGDAERQVLSRIRRSLEAMSRLAHDLVDVSSLDQGRPRIERTALGLPDFLAEAAELHRELADGYGVRIELELEAGLPEVQADAARLGRVLDNLLSNAVDHTPDGGRVVLRARHRPPLVEVEVADEGKGIEAAAFPHLFRPFAQAGETRRRGESHGLGLAISRAFVEAHGGTIHAENVPGCGAVFRFTLPVGGAGSIPEPAAARSASS